MNIAKGDQCGGIHPPGKEYKVFAPHKPSKILGYYF